MYYTPRYFYCSENFIGEWLLYAGYICIARFKSHYCADKACKHLQHLLDSGWQCSCIYDNNSSVLVRFIRLGRDGFVKNYKFFRTFPFSSKAAYRLLVRL